MKRLIPILLAAILGTGCPKKGTVATPPDITDSPPNKSTQPSKPATPSKTVKPGESVMFGDVKLVVKSVFADKVPLLDIWKKRSKSKEPALHVVIEITNVSESRKIDFTSWHGWYKGVSALVDNLGNKYEWVGLTPHQIEGAINQSASIYPGKSDTDILLFEVPVEKATSLTVTLPGQNIGANGDLSLTFNRSDWNNFKP